MRRVVGVLCTRVARSQAAARLPWPAPGTVSEASRGLSAASAASRQAVGCHGCAGCGALRSEALTGRRVLSGGAGAKPEAEGAPGPGMPASGAEGGEAGVDGDLAAKVEALTAQLAEQTQKARFPE